MTDLNGLQRLRLAVFEETTPVVIRNFERSFLLLLILTTLATAINAQLPQGTPTPTPSPNVPTGVSWIYAAAAVASAIASVIAWIAKIRWGKELEAVQNARLRTLEEAKANLEKNKDETIRALDKTVTLMGQLQDQTIKARDERLEGLKEVHAVILKGKEDEITTLLRSKEFEISAWKAQSSPDVMNTLKARAEQLQQIIDEKNIEIEKLKGHVKERPLDAADLALRAERLELEKNYLALFEAYQMKASSQSFSDKAVSGADQGKIESARSFLNQLGAAPPPSTAKAAEEETRNEDPVGKRTDG